MKKHKIMELTELSRNPKRFNEMFIPMKIYNDGTHLIGSYCYSAISGSDNLPVPKYPGKKEETVHYVEKELEFVDERQEFYDNQEDFSIKPDIKESQDFFTSRFKKSHNHAIDKLINENYERLNEECENNDSIIVELQKLIEEQCPEELDNVYSFEEYARRGIERIRQNYSARIKRFKRKALLNKWNYFVTLTLNPEKMTESDFRIKLKRTLSNFAYRRGWRYMGVFELSPEEKRLHYHALMYIPENEMVGVIQEIRDYSTKNHSMQVRYQSSFFLETFGINDFKPVDNVNFGGLINYLCKYLLKDNEKICYSRKLPGEIVVEVTKKDIICEFFDFGTKYILFNDVLDDELNYKVYIPNHIRKTAEYNWIYPKRKRGKIVDNNQISIFEMNDK